MSRVSNGRKPLVAERRVAAQKTPRARTRRRAPAPRRRSWPARAIRWVVHLVWSALWRGTAVVATFVGLAALYVALTLPEAEAFFDQRARGSVVMTDRGGEVFAWRGDQFGGSVTATSVSRHIRNAVIATEDKRFYWHPGVDPIGIANAARINLSEGRSALSGHGGSTLTQQTAKLICLGQPFDREIWPNETAYEAECRSASVWRKLREAVYALGMEIKYSKEDILTIYLNRAFLGSTARGFEAATQRYFGKPASQAGPAEAAMLAGLLVAPTRFAPTNDLQRSQDRAATVVRLMEEQGYLTFAEARDAQANPATLSDAASERRGNYFADWAMSTAPSFFGGDTTEDVEIATTLDPRIQSAAEAAVVEIFDTKVREGSEAEVGVVVMSADGAVRAIVGGRDMRAAGAFNHATMARRQTGSTFKPFVYAAALELGRSPFDMVEDAPWSINVPGSGLYAPKNYGDEYFGDVTLAEAMARSLNIPAVKLSEAVGRENVRKVAAEFGIASRLADGPALALGVSESTLLEMTGAYAGILNGGTAVRPYGIRELRIQGDADPIAARGNVVPEYVISPAAARTLVYMLHQAVETGTGARARIDGFEVAGKTGTTQSARDAWFIGFTADYVIGVWMGYGDNRPLTGVTGSGLPADIWRETVAGIYGPVPPPPLPMARDLDPAGARASGLGSATIDAGGAGAPSDDGVILNLLRSILGGG